jgi:hypothetical protein
LGGESQLPSTRWGEGHIDGFPAPIGELIAQRVDVIVVFDEVSIRAAQRATTMTPIVGMAADMVRTGLAASMARPGSNLTGVNLLAGELDAKRLEILHEAAPAARRMGALALPHPGFDSEPELDVALRDLHLDLVMVKVWRMEELTHGLDMLESTHVDAVNVLASPLANTPEHHRTAQPSASAGDLRVSRICRAGWTPWLRSLDQSRLAACRPPCLQNPEGCATPRSTDRAAE